MDVKLGLGGKYQQHQQSNVGRERNSQDCDGFGDDDDEEEAETTASTAAHVHAHAAAANARASLSKSCLASTRSLLDSSKLHEEFDGCHRVEAINMNGFQVYMFVHMSLWLGCS